MTFPEHIHKVQYLIRVYPHPSLRSLFHLTVNLEIIAH